MNDMIPESLKRIGQQLRAQDKVQAQRLQRNQKALGIMKGTPEEIRECLESLKRTNQTISEVEWLFAAPTEKPGNAFNELFETFFNKPQP